MVNYSIVGIIFLIIGIVLVLMVLRKLVRSILRNK